MEAPEVNEFVDEVYTIADHFTFTDRPTDAFLFITTHAKWVNLGFNFGSLLRDPDGLLRGEGKLIRHIRIAQEADLDAPGIRDLVRAAAAEAEATARQGREASYGCAHGPIQQLTAQRRNGHKAELLAIRESLRPLPA